MCRLPLLHPGRLDKDHSGFLDEEEVIQALNDLQINISPDEVSEMMAKCDEDGDGQVGPRICAQDRRACPAALAPSRAGC